MQTDDGRAVLLRADHLTLRYPARKARLGRPSRPPVDAVRDVSLAVDAGEILGVVGESGSGKSSLLRCLMLMERPTVGSIRYHGRELTELTPVELSETRQGMQIVFQNPSASLNPDMSVLQIVAEPLQQLRVGSPRERRGLALEALEKVGISASEAHDRPGHFSGGQKQRIAIARAIVVKPDILFADEAVSALDVTVAARVLDLLRALRDSMGFSMIFVAHDLAVVAALCDRIAVMKDGRLQETGQTADILHRPRAEYTRRLLEAARHTELPRHTELRF